MILFSITLTPYLIQDVFADQATLQSWVANDPDDEDATYSVGDTLTITFDVNTNATNGGTATDTEIKANFTFASPNIATGATFSGVWDDLKTFVITVDAVGTSPTIGTSTVAASGSNNIGTEADGQNNGLGSAHAATGTSSALTGDFGLFVAFTAGSGCSDCEAPTLGINFDGRRIVDDGFTYNGNSIDVERYFTPYPLVTVNVGKQNVAEFKIYDDKGPDSVSHFELAFGLASGESIGMSKAVINWDKSFDGIETVTLYDPENVLDKIKVTTSEGSCSDESQQKCLIVKVIHTFRAPLDFNILGTNVWDAKRNAWQNYYNHGIEVVGESLNPPDKYDGINKGHIYHLTEIGKDIAVDEFGDSWTFHHGIWNKDYVELQRITDSDTNVFTRMHSEFAKYKETQANNAIEQLLVLCPTCQSPYDNFADSTSIDYPERLDKLNDPEIQKKMAFESERAQNVMNHLLDPRRQ